MALPGAGRDVDLTWGGAVILGLREKGIALAGDPIDVTSDDDDGWQKLLQTGVVARKTVTISLSGVSKDRILMADYFAGTIAKTAIITYPDGTTLTGTFVLSAFSNGTPYEDAITFDATLMSSGAVVFVAGS